MRKVEKDVSFNGYTIPKGHFLCVAPSVTQLDEKRFPDPYAFKPGRFMNSDEGAGEWTIDGVDIAQKSDFLPFGAGRHRCIGEAFAYVQIKTIVSLFIREFTHKLVTDPASGKGKFAESDYTSLIVIPEKPSYLLVERRQ